MASFSSFGFSGSRSLAGPSLALCGSRVRLSGAGRLCRWRGRGCPFCRSGCFRFSGVCLWPGAWGFCGPFGCVCAGAGRFPGSGSARLSRCALSCGSCALCFLFCLFLRPWFRFLGFCRVRRRFGCAGRVFWAFSRCASGLGVLGSCSGCSCGRFPAVSCPCAFFRPPARPFLTVCVFSLLLSSAFPAASRPARQPGRFPPRRFFYPDFFKKLLLFSIFLLLKSSNFDIKKSSLRDCHLRIISKFFANFQGESGFEFPPTGLRAEMEIRSNTNCPEIGGKRKGVKI